jgi:hypothetical protein
MAELKYHDSCWCILELKVAGKAGVFVSNDQSNSQVDYSVQEGIIVNVICVADLSETRLPRVSH